ncbi:MAG: hypothetical protein LBT80_01670 [Lactobacillaceae bacterium]|jgi:hypothetical protein|nr:hypothetical protein [Lactobacillaceae bacterium]
MERTVKNKANVGIMLDYYRQLGFKNIRTTERKVYKPKNKVGGTMALADFETVIWYE